MPVVVAVAWVGVVGDVCGCAASPIWPQDAPESPKSGRPSTTLPHRQYSHSAPTLAAPPSPPTPRPKGQPQGRGQAPVPRPGPTHAPEPARISARAPPARTANARTHQDPLEDTTSFSAHIGDTLADTPARDGLARVSPKTLSRHFDIAVDTCLILFRHPGFRPILC